MSVATNFPWTRYWYRRGVRPTLVDDYLVSPTSKPDWFSPGQAATLKTLPELAAVPCLVLLGDPGTGKSSEIAAETVRLGIDSTDRLVVKRVDLKLRTESLIEKQVFRGEEFVGWTEGRHALVLFFDSMDECWRRLPELGPIIIDQLEPHLRKNRPPLYLRLGCRAAEWREEIEGDLRRVFGDTKERETVQVWELAPLTEGDVRIAAKASGVDEDFLSQVREREVSAFAAHPITLGMLLATRRDGGSLGRDRAEIYQKGCTLLCRDGHQDEKALPRLVSTVQQRLACSSYLAAVAVLSNRYVIFGPAERRPEEEAGTIAAEDLLKRIFLAGADVQITREVLAEVLQTGLFDAQPGDLFTWRHQSYAEFLAANYLRLRDIPAEEIVQLLCDTTSGRPRLWPQLEETACWVATLVPDVFDLLIESNADVFIRCDPVRLGPDRRARIVTGNLEQVRRHEAQVTQGREANRLNRLAHPGIIPQLAPTLADKAENVFVRDLAIDITRACELRELADELVAIAFSVDEVPRVRHAAAAALREMADTEIRAKVRAQLNPETLDDDDVRGCVLAILWPGVLTEDELVPLLTQPAKDNYIGLYQHFLAEQFRKGLEQANLVPLVRWARRTLADSTDWDHRQFEGAGSAVLLAAFQSIEKPDVRAEFMLAVTEHADDHRRLFKREGRDLAGEKTQRKILWREIVGGELPVNGHVISGSMREAGLAENDDFDWVIDEAASAAPRERSRWLELAFWLFRPLQRPEQITLLQPFAVSAPSVAERIFEYTTSVLVEKGGEPNWQKAQHYAEEKRKAERARRKSFGQFLDESLSSYEATQQPHVIWGLVARLASPVKDFDEEGGNNWGDVGWKHLSGDQRTRIRSLAPNFVSSVTVKSVEIYDKVQFYRSYVAGVSFLIDLVNIGSPWPAQQSAEFWKAWTPAIVQYQEQIRHLEDIAWQRTLSLAYDRAKPVFLEAIRRWLAGRGDRSFPEKRFELLPIGSDPDCEDVFLVSALESKRDDAMDFDFFRFLVFQRSARTEAILASWLPKEGRESHENGPFAEAALLCGRPSAYAGPAIDRILRDAEWGRRVFLQLTVAGGVMSNWVDYIEAERLVRVWECLDREFPGDPYDHAGDGTVTPHHNLAMFRSHLISCIQNRGTPDTVEAFRGLLRRHPEHKWIGQVLAQTRAVVRRESWKPPAALAAIAYFARTGTPPLCNDADLADAVKASLTRYQKLLEGPNPPTELWNESAGPVKEWTPKDEENVSDCVARHIERDLNHLRVFVARESELRQGTPGAEGDEPDLRITAPNASEEGERLTVIVEVKCSWNKETVTGLEEQLLNRYLRGLPCGIYVVAHFNCPSWSPTDYRSKQMLSRTSAGEVAAVLEGERQRLVATTSKRLDVVVLDAAV